MILDENVALVYSNFSKTYQFMNRYAIIPLCKHNNTALDPVYHLQKLFSTTIPPLYPAFAYIENEVINCVTYSCFMSRFNELLSLAGYSSDLYSCHSMR